jgi:hypothetical protein
MSISNSECVFVALVIRHEKRMLHIVCGRGRLFNIFPHFLLNGRINPLNAELNPTCHLLILLRDLTFMGKCIVSIYNKMQRHTVYLYLETALERRTTPEDGPGIGTETCWVLFIYDAFIEHF